jgi:hypothetical protein
VHLAIKLIITVPPASLKPPSRMFCCTSAAVLALQLDWATVDTAVAKLGPHLATLANMVHLAIAADDLPDEQHPQLAALVTGR